jgi:hypothetical protein
VECAGLPHFAISRKRNLVHCNSGQRRAGVSPCRLKRRPATNLLRNKQNCGAARDRYPKMGVSKRFRRDTNLDAHSIFGTNNRVPKRCQATVRRFERPWQTIENRRGINATPCHRRPFTKKTEPEFVI